MTDKKVIWSENSLNDLENIHNLLSQNSDQAAKKTIASLLNRVGQLEAFPKSGPIEQSLSHKKKKHRYLVEGNNKIVYRLEKQNIFIVRVFDARQNPEKLK